MSRLFALTAAAAIVLISGRAQGGLIGMNLVVNGDAETGDNSGWTGSFSAPVPPGTAGTTGLSDPGVIGDFSFHVGTGDNPKEAFQLIDISPLSAAVDLGDISWAFSILIQSRSVPDAADVGSARLSFLDVGGTAIGAPIVFTDTPVPNVFTWDAFSDSGVVPIGTRQLRVSMIGTRSGGLSTDAYFDNASLTLQSASAVPEPGSLLLVSIGGISLVACRRFRFAAGT